MGKTVTRSDLIKSVMEKSGLSRGDSVDLVAVMVGEICDAIVREEVVKISSFATFQVSQKKLRLGRNPKTGQPAIISPRRVITFRASSVLKRRILKSCRQNALEE
ncbi:integration host factor subunit alpha [Candidatus Liberibacter sp.]|uniref:integration host factor subunit alpha n=1 Tax=Candidatus Liberibacter sp. TaxID=34022 RepID=UPI0015F44CB8|nr:integration host factor subunit alpha [Candidatus Liberibacter sp.]MBA5724195.1 integration host factor subunit alpha [Candidatus Liberibacter sp.]